MASFLHKLLLFQTTALLGSVAWARGSDGWLPFEVPNPSLSYPECGNARATRVCDPDGVLSEQDRGEVASLIDSLELATKAKSRGGRSRCQRVGVQAFVALVRKIHSDANRRASSSEAAEFAAGIRESWGLEERYCLKYILIAISHRDAKIQISVGRRSFLGDDDVSSLLQSQAEAFRQGDYAGLIRDVLAQAGVWYQERHLGVLIPVYDDAVEPVDAEHPVRSVKNTNEAVAQPESGEVSWWLYLVVVMILVPLMGLLLACCLASSLRSRFCPCIAEEELAVIQVNGQAAYVDRAWAGYAAGGGELRSKSPSIVHSIGGAASAFPLHRSVSGQVLHSSSRAPSLLLPPGYSAPQRLSRKGSAATSLADGSDSLPHSRRSSSRRRSHRSASALTTTEAKESPPTQTQHPSL